jgi:hypothetical protein
MENIWKIYGKSHNKQIFSALNAIKKIINYDIY